MRQRNGFTLIEMLVALTILGLTSIILLQAISFGMRLWSSQIRNAAADEELHRARALLTRLIEQAYPQDPLATPEARLAPLDSDGHSLSVSAPATQASQVGGNVRWWIAPHPAASSREILISWSLVPSAPPVEDPRSEVLIHSVENLIFSFLIVDASGHGQWVERWRPEQPLPRLVRVGLQFPTSDRRQWEPLVVAPRLSSAAECQFDLVSRRCRGTL
jgi:general secretion pathway protein J